MRHAKYPLDTVATGFDVADGDLDSQSHRQCRAEVSRLLPAEFQLRLSAGTRTVFLSSYHWAFYIHIASGPISLILGLVLISERFRRNFPKWHRRLGRIQAVDVLFLVAPSGLWMAYHAQAGSVAVWGFGSLAIATGACVAMGWRSAVKRRFPDHRRWMWRSFLLLCSAVIIRIIGGLGTVTGFHNAWVDPLASWACWLVPLVVFELSRARNRFVRSSSAQAELAMAAR